LLDSLLQEIIAQKVLSLTPVSAVPRAISTYLSASVLLVLLTTPMYPSI